MGIFGLAKKGYGMLGKGKTVVKESFKTPGAIKFWKSFDNVMGDDKGLKKKSVTLPVVISGTSATLKNKKKEKKK